MLKKIISYLACIILISTSTQVFAILECSNKDIANPLTTEENLWKLSYENKIIDEEIELSSNIFDDEPYVKVTKPKEGYLYLFDREIFNIGFTLIIGEITVEVETSDDISEVDIYFDNNLKFTDYTEPYSRLYQEKSFGLHKIKAVAQDEFGETIESDEIDFLLLNFRGGATSSVVINEIMSNPSETDAGNEWVELYNKGNDINIKGWSISNRNANAIATLPDWEFPKDTYLVVYFGSGTNDNDFSDGNGKYCTGTNQEVFDNGMDECALYAGTSNANNIIDFISYCGCCDGVYTPGIAYNHARAAGIWDELEYFDPTEIPLHPGSRVRGLVEGDSIGRDSLSNDSNTPQDWDISGGPDAFNPSLGKINYDVFGIVSRQLTASFSEKFQEKKDWTVMVYMADSDDLLENNFFQQLDQLESVGTNDDMNIVFEIDGYRNAREMYQSNDGTWRERNRTKTFRGFLLKDNNTSYVDFPVHGKNINYSANRFVNAYNPVGLDVCIGEINTGTAAPLTEFVNWAARWAPADHYVLILGGHGAGWKGLLPDANSGDDYLYMNELKTALENANILTLDILGFDCCMMAMVEVGYQIRLVVDYMVASEELDIGWNYKDIFTHLQNNIGISAEALASYMVTSYDNYHGWWDCRTLSAVNLKGDFLNLVNKISLLGQNLKRGMEDWGDSQNAAFAIHNIEDDNCQKDVRDVLLSLTSRETFDDRNYKDLYILVDRIGNNNGIYENYKKPWNDILALLVEGGPIVKNEIHGVGHNHVHGLSIYFPRNQVNFYRTLTCDSGWQFSLPFDAPHPSRLTDPASSIAIYAEDFTIEWGKVPYYGAPPHPWPQTPNLRFREDTMWDEFLHRYYKPCADAGPDQTFSVEDCDDCVEVTLSGVGSSSADDDLNVHRYTWDFDATVDSKPGLDPDVDDMDRSGIDDLDDELDAENVQVTQEFCVGTHIVTLTVWDDHHLLDTTRYSAMTNDVPNRHWKTDQDQCVITVTCDEDNTLPIVYITDPQDGDYVTNPVEFTVEASDYGSGIVELDFLLEWPGGSYSDDPYLVDPPAPIVYFTLGPFNLNPDVSYYEMTIYAKDASDNIGSDSVIVYPKIEKEDTTPPITTASFEPELRIVTLTAIDPPHGDDPISGVCATYYFIDEGATTEYFEPFPLPEGTHDVTFWSVDCANNVEDPNTETFG